MSVTGQSRTNEQLIDGINNLRRHRPPKKTAFACTSRTALISSQRAQRLAKLILVLLLASNPAIAQTTTFTYQGRLSDNKVPSSGSYDFEFKLFDTATVGTGIQQGATLQRLTVAVSSGIFTVQLDFGACASCFNGAARFLEIAVKPTSGSTYTTLSPRQALTSAPYAIKSLTATAADGLSVACVSCITSSQIASVNGNAVSGTIPLSSVPGGSVNYIQNGTTQQAANFNISGNGAIGGALGLGTSASSAKLQVSSTALDQHLYLSSAAPSLALGNMDARSSSTMNSIFGLSTAFGHYGVEAGGLMIANYGSAHGSIYIDSNYSGGDKSVILQPYVGNVVIGTTTTDSSRKLDVESSIPNGTAVYANTTSDGWGVYADGGVFGVGVQGNNSADGYGVIGKGGVGVYGFSNTEVGAGVVGSGTNYAGYFEGRLHSTGFLSIAALGTSGSTSLCRNASNQISTCSSSLRYKTNLVPFTRGLELILNLQPTTFDWKTTSERDVGLIAEEVARVEPLFTFKNSKGEVEGVKYANLSAAFINAFKEQQAQIKEQQRQIETQLLQIEALKRLVCANHADAAICKAN